MKTYDVTKNSSGYDVSIDKSATEYDRTMDLCDDTYDQTERYGYKPTNKSTNISGNEYSIVYKNNGDNNQIINLRSTKMTM